VWRETFMILDAVKHALYTGVRKLGTCMRNWPAILEKLAEPPRQRLSQLTHLAQGRSKPG
jgi:hypothetical protein